MSQALIVMTELRVDILAMGLFMVSATALLGSPGPGIAALIAVGRAHGLVVGLRFYFGLQVGLAMAATITALGLFSVLNAFPSALRIMTILATAYLLYLGWRIATAPIGAALNAHRPRSSAAAGFALGITNPKAFVVFASLFASRSLVIANASADVLLKWMLCVVVILVVDIAWLLVGVAMHQATLKPRTERILNLTLAAMIVAAAVLTVF